MELSDALSLVRHMIIIGVGIEEALHNPIIPHEFVDQIRKQMQHEQLVILEDPEIICKEKKKSWVDDCAEIDWYFWPKLKEYLISYKNWTLPAIKSLDDVTSIILGHLRNPSDESFFIKGLVVGYVQSGKTANYTSLIAKAVDTGYKLIIILAGVDNGLRQQTQIRLNHELVGYPQPSRESVPLPPIGKQWHQFTSEDFKGDFRPGYANHAALQGEQPVLLVIKKNGTILSKLISWLKNAPKDILSMLPVLVIDDEADQASIDTKGDGLDVEPSTINRKIRQLLNVFSKKAYVAYTATPYANILIRHDKEDKNYGKDLYPEDFIIVLPKPDGYFGAEEFFGYYDEEELNDQVYNVIRDASDAAIDDIEKGLMPESLKEAICDYLLSTSIHIVRQGKDVPSTMLLHGSQKIDQQRKIAKVVEKFYLELSAEWKYDSGGRLEHWFRKRYQVKFQPFFSVEEENPSFESLIPILSETIDSTQVKVINSSTGELLDYYQEPTLKAIAVGGNRLSRGLTLEGLITSYFFRPARQYDTLMQMGRWFGFRKGYADIIRIYMPPHISEWFKDLAFTEAELRSDLKQYELQEITPLDLGARIRQHPVLQVTSRAKMRDATQITLEQSYSGTAVYTLNFPFDDKEKLSTYLPNNIVITKRLFARLPEPTWEGLRPIWRGLEAKEIINYLKQYKTLEDDRLLSLPLIIKYIEKQVTAGELIKWDFSVIGLKKENPTLGVLDLGLQFPVPMIARSRLVISQNSIGALTSPGDEAVCLTDEEYSMYQEKIQSVNNARKQNSIARSVRSPKRGLLLLYPISRFSSLELGKKKNRRPLFDDPTSDECDDVIAFAISFPVSLSSVAVNARYVVGSLGWSAN